MKPLVRITLQLSIMFAIALGALLPGSQARAAADALPVIEIWYGLNQSFGHHGQPQEQVNILGNVSDADGIASLTYSLNGVQQGSLSIGPDSRRLQNPGDFNVELYYDELQNGPNTVIVTAVDGMSQNSQAVVTVNKNVIPWSIHTHTVDWSTVTAINDLAQVVDGKWTLTPDGVRTVTDEVGYDRLIAIGEMSWTNYEVSVPMTVHGIDDAGYESPSNGPAVGLLLDWAGHTDNPVPGEQPNEGYLPYGAIGFYRWMDEASDGERLRLYLNDSLEDWDTGSWILDFGVRYILKMRVEHLPGQGQSYKLKIWESGQAEPAVWNMSGQGSLDDPQSGSLMLIAHHVDVTYGNVNITALSSPTYSLTVATSGSGSVTKNPQKVSYSFGEQVTLTASPVSGWTFTGWSDGNLDNPRLVTVTGDISLTANFTLPTYLLVVAASPTGSGSVARSPDKAAYSTNEQVTLTAAASPGWTFAGWSGDPCTVIGSGTCKVTMDGGKAVTANFTQNQYHLTVTNTGSGSTSLSPAKAAYTYGEIVTLTANPSAGWSFAGWSGGISGSVNPREVTVSGDMAVQAVFIHDPYTLSVAAVGSGAVNVEPLQDYYRSGDRVVLTAVAAPGWSFAGWGGGISGSANPREVVVNGDLSVEAVFLPDPYTLSIKTVGSGAVNVEPSQEFYKDGDQVLLSAAPAPGWTFAGWGGDLTGKINPAAVKISKDLAITATFTREIVISGKVFIPLVIGPP